MTINPVSFVGTNTGAWKTIRQQTICGDDLPTVSAIDIRDTHSPATTSASWILRGTNNHTRYSNRTEVSELKAKQEGLGRTLATHAALIPIRKSSAWWQLAQDERRAIFEEQSGHIAKSMPYLPAIARRLYHSRDLGEPFDFLTWFEFAPEHTAQFDELLVKLRTSHEWTYVDREIDIRLIRA